jgi:preprotein translocase subunit SecF
MSDDVKIGAEVELDPKSTQNIKTLKQQLRDALKEAQTLSAQDLGSKEAVAAQKRVAALRDSIEDTNESIAAFTGAGQFKAIGNAVQGIAGGFAAAQGAIALFGGESEELQKTLVRLNAAMAFSQGLSQLEGLKDSFGAVGRMIETNVIPALSTLRGAFIATGIGAVIAAVGLLAANWDKVMRFVKGTSYEQEKYTKHLKETTEQTKKALEQFDLEEARLRSIGVAEKEIIMLRRQKRQEAIDAQKLELENQKKILEQQIDNFAKQAAESATGLASGNIVPYVYNMLFGEDVKDIKGAQDKVKELNDSIRALQVQQYTDLKTFNDLVVKEKEDNKQKQLKAEEKFTKEMYKQIDAQKRATQSLREMEEQLSLKDEQIQGRKAEIDYARWKKDQEEFKKRNDAMIDLEVQKVENQRQLANETFGILQNLNTLAGENFEVQKSLSIASTGIDTFEATQSSFKAATKNPITTVFPAYPYIAAGLALTAGLVRMRQMAQIRPGVRSVGGGGAPSTPSAPSFTPAQGTNVQGAGNVNLSSQANQSRVYVLETDIRSTTNRVDVIQANAQFK